MPPSSASIVKVCIRRGRFRSLPLLAKGGMAQRRSSVGPGEAVAAAPVGHVAPVALIDAATSQASSQNSHVPSEHRLPGGAGIALNEEPRRWLNRREHWLFTFAKSEPGDRSGPECAGARPTRRPHLRSIRLPSRLLTPNNLPLFKNRHCRRFIPLSPV